MSPTNNHISIANPLPSTLSHYVVELEATLDRVGISHSRESTKIVEGFSGVRGKAVMLHNALHNARQGRRAKEPTLLTWPSLGLLETRLWSGNSGRNLVVIHDPIPIRKQIGYDRFSRTIANLRSSKAPRIVSHSPDALEILQRTLPAHEHILLPHPILTEQYSPSYPPKVPHKIVVAGQFKPERNVGLLEEIGPELDKIGAQGYIYGRGWPDVRGWNVDSRFLSEEELDGVLADASLVLIPYSRYYQSGIAVRALELGTMSISPPNSFAYELLGADGVVPTMDSGTWLKTIDLILRRERLSSEIFSRFQSHVDALWTKALR